MNFDDPAARVTTLPGGVRVVSETVPGARSAAVGFFVGVGSRDEGDGEHGASHFLEHVLFKGTPTRDAAQISATVESRGGDLNAYTTREYTCFHARVLADQLPTTVELFCDMLANSLVAPADVDVEREVILDEIAMNADDPSELAGDEAIRLLLAGSALARQVIGSSTSIRRMSAATVKRFWQQHYLASTTVVSVVGAVDHDELCSWLAGFDEALARREDELEHGAWQRTASGAASTAGIVRHTNELAQASVVLAFDGIGLHDPRREALGLLTAALGGGMSSRLFQEVREKRALAYTIDCSNYSWSDAGQVTIEWQALPERTAEIMDTVRQIVAQVRREGITADELEAARGQIIGQTVLHYESPSARMSRLGRAVLQGEWRSIDQLLDAFAAVTLDEVNALAATVFAPVPVVSLAGADVPRRLAVKLQQQWTQP